MAHDDPHPVQGQIGTTLRVKFLDAAGAVRDISAATKLEIVVKPPTGSSSILPGGFTTDGTDGLAEYVDTTGILFEFGCWRIWGKAYFVAPVVFTTEVGTFEVEAAPPAPLLTTLTPAGLPVVVSSPSPVLVLA